MLQCLQCAWGASSVHYGCLGALRVGSFSVWHWIIVFFGLLLPLFFILRPAPLGHNRFGEPPAPVNFIEAIRSFYKNYTNFTGRASRSEFWYATLYTFIVSNALDLVDSSGLVTGAFGISGLVPAIAVTTRRLHDINRSGWHLLLFWLFPVGTMALFVWYWTPARPKTGA